MFVVISVLKTLIIRVCTVVARMLHNYFDLFVKGNYSDEVLIGFIKKKIKV